MSMPVNRFYVSQKITLMVNRYQVLGANPDGSEARFWRSLSRSGRS